MKWKSNPKMKTELYKKHRPKELWEVIGQTTTTQIDKMLKNKKFPHASLFAGPSGCGKTTLARIIKDKLNCSDSDFNEVNCADFRGIDFVREIRTSMNLAPLGGSVRVWLIDEAHQLSSQAQNAFLKILEDTPQHVYFILATTEPQKLLKTIRTRCTTFTVQALNFDESETLIKTICQKEEIELEEEVIENLIKLGEGSARQILVLMDSIISIDDPEEQLQLLFKSDTKREAIEICRALFKPKPIWGEVAAVLKSVNEEPESLRWMILSYANSILMKQKNKNGKSIRAYEVIDSFKTNFYDSKKAGLTAACFEVVFADSE